MFTPTTGLYAVSANNQHDSQNFCAHSIVENYFHVHACRGSVWNKHSSGKVKWLKYKQFICIASAILITMQFGAGASWALVRKDILVGTKADLELPFAS